MSYEESFVESMKDPKRFWAKAADKLPWYRKPSKILSVDAYGHDCWFTDGVLNASYACLDVHVDSGFGNEIALVYDSPVTNIQQKYTYSELLHEVAKVAGAMQRLGLKKGDTAVIYMPMIPQAVIAMLACARIGVIHSVVFGGFAAHELALRIDDCSPKIIFSATEGIEIDRSIPYQPLLREALAESVHQPDSIIVYDRKLSVPLSCVGKERDWDLFVSGVKLADAVPVESNHPLYILYTSGTTGTPKGVVRDTGGYCVALRYSMETIYGINPGEVFWAASDVGWVVGHSYIVYAPLLNRNTTILYEGKPIKTPDSSAFWRVISEHRVNVMFTAPTAIRAIKKEDPNGNFIQGFDLSCLRTQFLAGERCDVATWNWYKEHINIPVIDHWWQTESGWPMIANFAGLDLLQEKPGSAGKAVPGYHIQILNEEGQKCAVNQEGYLAIERPLPPGFMRTLWNNAERFQKSYFSRFEDYYFSGDGAFMDEEGYLYLTGRVDDVINVAGHRLSTAEMEEVVAHHTSVAECAVIGVKCDLKGQIPEAFVVLKSGESENESLKKAIKEMVRNSIGAIASLQTVHVVQRLPKTRSGKILRRTLRSIVDKEKYTVPSTIDDVTILSEIEEYLETKQGN